MNKFYFFKTRLVLIGVVLLLSFNNIKAQSSISYSIGQIIAAGPAGLVLADGTIAHAEVVVLGSGVPLSNHGTYETMQMGGFLNGINNNTDPSGSVNDSALTIPQYDGSRRVGDFTRISAFPTSIDNGRTSNYGNAIGFRIWFSKPINVKQFLMLDCDGNGDNSDPNNPATNGEWFSCFGYNGTTLVTPSVITLSAGTDLTTNTRTVNNNWSALVASKIPGAPSFTTMVFPRITENHQSVDPDDIHNQGLFHFTSAVDNVFFLWGIFGTAAGGANTEQNSGVSPLVFSLYTDFGDAPDVYHTSKVNNGASHEIYNYLPGSQNSTLTIGSGITFESTGVASSNANTDIDEGIATLLSYDCGSSTYATNVSILNNTGFPANLYAWADFNENGEFNSGEALTSIVNSSAIPQTIPLQWSGIVKGANCGAAGNIYLRVRLTLENMIDDPLTSVDERSFGGVAGGEVEDYRIVALPEGSPLPVRLISFSSSIADNKVMLTWTAENEISNHYYELERSTDGINFTPIDRLVNNVSTIGYNTYQSVDLIPAHGLNYYRLKMIDKNGTVVYSKVLVERMNGLNIPFISVVPNPFVSTVNVNITLDKADLIAINIIDGVGKNVYHNTLKGNAGINWIPVNRLSNLAKGVYIMDVKTSRGTTQYKLVKQ